MRKTRKNIYAVIDALEELDLYRDSDFTESVIEYNYQSKLSEIKQSNNIDDSRIIRLNNAYNLLKSNFIWIEQFIRNYSYYFETRTKVSGPVKGSSEFMNKARRESTSFYIQRKSEFIKDIAIDYEEPEIEPSSADLLRAKKKNIDAKPINRLRLLFVYPVALVVSIIYFVLNYLMFVIPVVTLFLIVNDLRGADTNYTVALIISGGLYGLALIIFFDALIRERYEVLVHNYKALFYYFTPDFAQLHSVISIILATLLVAIFYYVIPSTERVFIWSLVEIVIVIGFYRSMSLSSYKTFE